MFDLYGLGEKVNFAKFDPFKCCREPANGYISDLVASLKEAHLTTPLSQYAKATKSIYTWIFLSKVVAVFNLTHGEIFRITPQDPIVGQYGRGPVDYSINIPASGTVVVITEVQREDYDTGIAQNMVQIESVTAGKKREIEDTDAGMEATDAEEPIERCFGIVTDVRSWIFLEHTRRDGKIKFKLSEQQYIVSQQLKGTKRCVFYLILTT